MALIKGVQIDKTTMRSSATSRSVTITGDSDAVFSLQVVRSSDGEFYDFSTSAFEDDYTSQSRLVNKSPGSYSISFPAVGASGDTYTIRVFAEPHFNTKFSFGDNRLYYSTTIKQNGNTVVNLKTDGSISIITAETIDTSTGSPVDKFVGAKRSIIEMKDTQLTVPPAVGNYGVFITTPGVTSDVGEWDADDLYWTTEEILLDNPAGDGVSGNTVVVADLTSLVVGMELTYHKGTTEPSSATTISSIDTGTKTITFSTSSAFEDGETMTFRAYGPDLIKKAIGIELELTNATCKLGQESTTSRGTFGSGSHAGVYVNGTGGIANGATVRCKFIDKTTNASGVASPSACVVDHNPTGSSPTAGHITQGTLFIANGSFVATTTATFNPPASVNVPIKEGTIIYIDGSSADIYLSGTLSISKYPTTTPQDIYIDLSKIFTIGINT